MNREPNFLRDCIRNVVFIVRVLRGHIIAFAPLVFMLFWHEPLLAWLLILTVPIGITISFRDWNKI